MADSEGGVLEFYLCANFSLSRPLDLGPMYATDVRQTDVRQHHRFMSPPIGGGHN